MKRFFEEYGAVILSTICAVIIIAVLIGVGGNLQTGTGSIFNKFVSNNKDASNTVLYKVEYNSSTGKKLSVSSVSGVLGSSKDINPVELKGYNTPAPQNVKWDTDKKVITFVYTPIEYTITYNTDGGRHTNPLKYTIESPDIKIKNPTREGSNFTGWTSKDITTPTFEPVILSGSTGNKEYTANWSVLSYKYNVTYESTTGKLLEKVTITKPFGTVMTVTANEKAGYITPAPQEIKFDSTANKEIKFKYEPIEYRINYQLDGGSLSQPVSTFNVESNEIKLPVPTKQNYKFLGWVGDNGTVPQKDVTIPTGTTGDKNYQAVWELNEVTLTLDPNGGAVSTPSKKMIVGTPYGNLPTPTRNGYTFKGWYTDKTTGTLVKPTDTIKGNTTLYARWSANEYSYNITLKSSTGKILKTETLTKPFGTTVTITPSEVKGYTTPAAQKIVFDTTTPKNIAFTYNIINYKITYSGHGGYLTTTTVAPTEYNVESGIVKLPQASRKGYQFANWTLDKGTARDDLNFTAPDCMGTSKTFTLNKESVLSLFVNSRVERFGSFRLTNSKNENIIEIDNGEVFINLKPDTYTMSATVGSCSDSGYIMIQNAKLHESTKATSFNAATMTGDLEFHAIWEQSVHTVSFNANGGTVNANNRTYKHGSQYGELPTPTRTGHEFLGWYTAPTGGNKVLPTHTVEADTVLYAQWKVANITITLNPNGGSCSTSTLSVIPGNPIGQLPVPTRNGYTFNGWYTSPSGGTKVDANQTFSNSTTLYAQWAGNQVSYTVVFRSATGKQLGQQTLTKPFGTVSTVTPSSLNGYVTPQPQTVNFDTTNPKVITFTYTPIQYKINVDLNGGTASGIPQTYTIETPTFTLPQPTPPSWETDKIFGGWASGMSVAGNRFSLKTESLVQVDITESPDASWDVLLITDVYTNKDVVKQTLDTFGKSRTYKFVLPAGNYEVMTNFATVNKVSVSSEIKENVTIYQGTTGDVGPYTAIYKGKPSAINNLWFKNAESTLGITKDSVRTITFATSVPVDNPTMGIEYVSFDASAYQDRSLMGYWDYEGNIIIVNLSGQPIKIVSSTADGVIRTSNMFSPFYYATSIRGLEMLDMSNVTSAWGMFKAFGSKTTGRVTISGYSNWDVSKLNDIGQMFANVGLTCNELVVDGFYKWQLKDVTTAKWAFFEFGNPNLTSPLRVNLSNSDFRNCTDMSFMFYQSGVNYINTPKNIPVSTDITMITTKTFFDATDNNKKYLDGEFVKGNGNVSHELQDSLTPPTTDGYRPPNERYLLVEGPSFKAKMDSLNTTIRSIKFVDTPMPSSGVTEITGLGTSANTAVIGWYTPEGNVFISSNKAGVKVIANQNSSKMFGGNVDGTTFMGNVEYLDVTKLDASYINNLNFAFMDLGKYVTGDFKIIGMETWNTRYLRTMVSAFQSTCSAATNCDLGNLGNLRTKSVTNMQFTFRNACDGYNCKTFNVGNIGNWATTKVENVSGMFSNAGRYANYSLDVSSWDVTNITDHSNFANGVENKITAPKWLR